MIGATRLAMCKLEIEDCAFMRLYTVWRKTYWERGVKKNDRHWIVLDNTSMRRYQFDNNVFNKHFRLLGKDDIKPKLWKKIQEKPASVKKKAL